MDIMRIAVLGVGTLGRGIVERFTTAGFNVRGYDSDAKRLSGAKKWLLDMRALLVATGLLESERRGTAVRLTKLVLNASDALSRADLVIDASDVFAPDARAKLYKEFTVEASPNAVICVDAAQSNVSELLKDAGISAERVVYAGWLTPVSTLRAASLEFPSDMPDVTEAAVRKAFSGASIRILEPGDRYIETVTRLHAALLREAAALMDSGVPASSIERATAEVIGPCMAAAGILGWTAQAEQGVLTGRFGHAWKELSADNSLPEELFDSIAAGEFDEASVNRDAASESLGWEKLLARLFMVLKPAREPKEEEAS